MEIGLFQLENLLHAQTRFLLLDLRRERSAVAADLVQIMEKAVALDAAQIENYLVKEKIHEEAPIVLVCENGQVSQAASSRLEKLGYRNIYVVERGIEGLLSDL